MSGGWGSNLQLNIPLVGSRPFPRPRLIHQGNHRPPSSSFPPRHGSGVIAASGSPPGPRTLVPPPAAGVALPPEPTPAAGRSARWPGQAAGRGRVCWFAGPPPRAGPQTRLNKRKKPASGRGSGPERQPSWTSVPALPASARAAALLLGGVRQPTRSACPCCSGGPGGVRQLGPRCVPWRSPCPACLPGCPSAPGTAGPTAPPPPPGGGLSKPGGVAPWGGQLLGVGPVLRRAPGWSRSQVSTVAILPLRIVRVSFGCR